MSTFIPLGPPHPKKPKPKTHKFIGDVYGYTDCEDEFLLPGVELYASTGEDFELVESGIYTLDSGDEIEIIDGIVQ